jgi:hypothetical protein
LALQASHRFARCLFIERADDVAAKVQTFGHAHASSSRCDGHRRWECWVPYFFFEAAADVDLVAMTFGRDQSRQGTVHLDHRIVGGGRAVNDEIGGFEKCAGIEPAIGREHGETGHEALRLVFQRARGFH